MNVREFLNENGVTFEVIQHQPAYDAQRLAQTVHVSGNEVAKTVLLRTDGPDPYVVAVLPATSSIDFDKLRRVLNVELVELATEIEMRERCPDCEIGTLPPFGSQYDMKTVVERRLTDDERIVFEGNNHEEAIRMKYADFDRLEKPQVCSLAVGA